MAGRPATRSRAPKASEKPSKQAEKGSTRTVLDGHTEELLGVGVIVVGVLIGLGVYFEAGGPVGRALDAALGTAIGIGRFALPIALVAVGVALVGDGRSEHRVRLTLGLGLAAVAVLGLAHVANGPAQLDAGVDALSEGGGVVGYLVGEPLRRLLSTPGAVVVLLGVVLASVVVLSRRSVRDLASGASRGVAAGAKPAIDYARRALGDMSTLSDDRQAPDTGAAQGSPVLYDYAAETAETAGDATADGPSSRSRSKRTPSPFDAPDPADRVGGVDEQLAMDLGPGAEPGRWRLPPLSVLGRSSAQEIDRGQVETRGRELERALASHGVETRVVGMTVGPTVTRYELELAPGVKVAAVTSLHRDIAYAMASPDVRILAPIPGRSAIGVEVPNSVRQLVTLGDLLHSAEAKARTHPLEVAIGRDIAGRPMFMNLATMPHLLVAGATGAGKSSAINCMVTSLLMSTTPEQVRLILVDPKRVEMGQYNRLPHLLTQVVANPKKAANALGWAVKEMERRYDLLHEVGVRDITGYNAAFDRGDLRPEPGSDRLFERLPFIVVVVDELNDLMMVAARDVEESITRIAQMARAVGIHLVIATQRPSVNVLTGVIKANVPARMAFAVSSLTDSRVILDQPGAERLVGKGDMLLLGPASSIPQRIQGAFVSEDEVRKIVGHWRRQAPETQYVEGVEGDEHAGGGLPGVDGDDDDEVLVRQAMELVVRSQLGSTSMLQRKLKIGFARAGRIMDLLEQRGVVGPSEGSKARLVLMTPEELDLLLEAGEAGS